MMRVVPARHGWLWVRAALGLFAKKPLLWLLLTMAYLAAISIAVAIPILGIVLGVAAVPAFTASFISVARDIDAGRAATPTALLSGFRERPREMAILGAIYFAGCLAVFGITTLIDGGALIDALRRRQPSEGAQTGILLVGLFYLPVMLAFWFAPALVAWERMPAPKALFFSFFAALRNWKAIIVYGVMLAALTQLVAMVVVLGLRMFGGGAQALGLVMFPLLFTTLAVIFASGYTSYRDVFTEATGSS